MRSSYHPTFGIPGLFVTGTDTGVGKTQVTAAIARELTEQNCAVSVFKPVCSGAIEGEDGSLKWDDVERLRDAVEHRQTLEEICPQRFLAPLAPPVAARMEDREVDDHLLMTGLEKVCQRSDAVLIEGAGGLLCPVMEEKFISDLACDFGFPILIVGRLGLGTINHTLMTVRVAEAYRLTVAGIVLSQTSPDDDDPSTSTNPEEIAKRTGVPVLGILPYGERQLLPVSSSQSRIGWAELFWSLFVNHQRTSKHYE